MVCRNILPVSVLSACYISPCNSPPPLYSSRNTTHFVNLHLNGKCEKLFPKHHGFLITHAPMHALHYVYIKYMWILSPSAPIRPSLSSSAAHRKPLVSLSVRTRAPGVNLWRKNLAYTEPKLQVRATPQ